MHARLKTDSVVLGAVDGSSSVLSYRRSRGYVWLAVVGWEVVVVVIVVVSVFPVLPVFPVRVPMVVLIGVGFALVLVVVVGWPFVLDVFIEPVAAAGGSWGVMGVVSQVVCTLMLWLKGCLVGWERWGVPWRFADEWFLEEFVPFEWGELADHHSQLLM